MEATRSSLCEKLETLEQQVVGTVSEARSAVTETVGNVKDAVQDTVDTVRGTVKQTVESVRETFNLAHQVERHPWAMFGGAVAAGFIGGRLLAPDAPGRPGSRGYQPQGTAGQSRGRSAQSWAAARETPVDAETGGSRKGGWLSGLGDEFASEIDRLKSMAIGAGIGLLRDYVVQSAPQPLRPGLGDTLDRITAKLGGENFEQGAFADDGSGAASTTTTGRGMGNTSGRTSKATARPV